MSELLDAVSDKLGTSRKAAFKRYREILETGDANNADELMELAAKLAKTDIDVRRDMQTLNSWKHMDDYAAQLEATKHKLAGADAAAVRFSRETEEILENRRAEQLRLNKAAAELSVAQSGSGKVFVQMRELEQRHPELLASA
jgi:site-specific recombinase